MLKERISMRRLFTASRRNFAVGGLLCLTMLCLSARHMGQSTVASHEDLVSVKSWKQGTRTLPARTIEVRPSGSSQYEWDLYSASKDPTFRLRLRSVTHGTPGGAKFSCWSADLREISTDATSGATVLGPYLLRSEGPGGGDYFPDDDWAAFICPVENPKKILDGPLYAIKATRQFLIEGFALELRVLDYRLDKHGNFDQLQLRIDVSAP